MITALNSKNEIVLAYSVKKEDGPFLCRFCKYDLTFKNGVIKASHFSHAMGKNGVSHAESCIGSKKYCCGGESQTHIELKTRIYNDAIEDMTVRKKIKDVQLEYRVGNSIIDVAIIGTYRKIAVEVQISHISLEKMLERMHDHYLNGFSTLWVLGKPGNFDAIKSDSEGNWKSLSLKRNAHYVAEESIFFYDRNLKFETAHLMGYSYKTFKKHKFRDKPISLYETIDEEITCDFVDIKCVTIPERDRWWIEWEKKQL